MRKPLVVYSGDVRTVVGEVDIEEIVVSSATGRVSVKGQAFLKPQEPQFVINLPRMSSSESKRFMEAFMANLAGNKEKT